MKAIIQNHLKQIEQAEDVKILLAVESGSRAWGFPSPDSDYDVRFIYVRTNEFYLKLEKTSDVIEYMLDEELDINGWDLKKALCLLKKSNPTLFEWIASPIVYYEAPVFERIRNIAAHCFLSRPALYHYLNMARNNNREFLRRDRVRLKKYFYVLRPILACKWILARQTPPPMLFAELVEAELGREVRSIVDGLLERKAVTSELGEQEPIAALNGYIEKELSAIEEAVGHAPKQDAVPWEQLNRLFLSFLRDYE
ncbi:nucleotidyltransferase domain-containing protein [Christensenella tenuis]|jgi:uncharacterized protein|uniref:Nucleotidyltransferase domain-containing protein n=1 Tax=Christensenella tenuis TaxID=2763033 RepID=A0ABR7EFI7_9FIRM|nr:nucleotidyltransferase domain-containing protein [Christensenella tenuis]MBC5648517.1 nucleotidyltransferase domain-containing protein [Christensenella tenuis]